MSWESTVPYYQQINAGVRQRLGELHSAPLVLFSVDFSPLAELQKEGVGMRSPDPVSPILFPPDPVPIEAARAVSRRDAVRQAHGPELAEGRSRRESRICKSAFKSAFCGKAARTDLPPSASFCRRLRPAGARHGERSTAPSLTCPFPSGKGQVRDGATDLLRVPGACRPKPTAKAGTWR